MHALTAVNGPSPTADGNKCGLPAISACASSTRIAAGPIARICAPPLVSGNMTRSEEHTSELQSLMRISYAVFCLKKKKYNHVCSLPLEHKDNEDHQSTPRQ